MRRSSRFTIARALVAASIAIPLSLVQQQTASAYTATTSFNNCLSGANGAGPSSQVGDSVYNYYLVKNVNLLCGSYTGTGLRHIDRSHPEIEDDPGPFFRCLNKAIKFSSYPRNGSTSTRKVLQLPLKTGDYVEVVVENSSNPATVVTAYTSYGQNVAVGPKAVQHPRSLTSALAIWCYCGS